MNIKRFLLGLIAFASLVMVTGCRHHCCGDSRSYAPPAPCCNTPAPPPNAIPVPGP